jgi:hypothetical membrane protein
MEIVDRANQTRKAGETTSAATLTRVLLACGVMIAPVFMGVGIVQVLTRPGFDIKHLAISSLSLGDLGWIQIANFEITGLLAIACAVGLRRALRGGRGGTWGPVLIGVLGVGTIVSGIFNPDPAFGFPPGAPAGMPETMSTHATIHTIASMASFASMTTACFVLGRAFASIGRGKWAIYCVASGILVPVLLVLGLSTKDWVGVFLAVMVAIGFGCISAASARLSADVSKG